MTTTALSEVLADMAFNASEESPQSTGWKWASEHWKAKIESAIAGAEPVAPVSGDFIRRSNEDYAAWCKITYVSDSLDERGFRSLDGLWAWQEQERRKTVKPAAKVEAPDLVLQLLVAGGFVDPAKVEQAREIIAGCAPTPASVPDGWAMVPRVATSAMISSGWESGKLVGDTRIIISVSGVWDAMISTAAAHNTPASDYALCCDTPAYCSSVRRCTATDAVLDGPQTITKKVCDGCPHLKTEWWKDYLENDETDSGTSATCTLAGKNISAYWSKESPPPVWCPIEVPPANQEGAAP